jgi:hypothetical protein
LNEVNQIENFIQLDNAANRQVLNSDKFATKVMKLKTPASVQSFIPGKSITMDSHALVANVGYFYIHKDARTIVSEHQLEKNGFNITDVKEGNMSTQRVVSKDGKSFSFAKQWSAPLPVATKNNRNSSSTSCLRVRQSKIKSINENRKHGRAMRKH